MAAEKTERLRKQNEEIDRFLCRALRGEPAPWAELGANIGTEQVLLRCQHHGVASLLHHGLEGQQAGLCWPQDFRDALRKISKAQVAQEMLRGHYLNALLTRLAARGVRCLLIKGEALANTLYPLPGSRTRGDSDLFIAIADIDKARAAVTDCGYVIVSPLYKSHQFTVRGKGAAVDVFEFDVHWRILNAPRFARKISFDEAYAGSIELPGMQPTRTLNAVDTLLLHCMHRSGSDWHDRDRLIWLYDIHLLVCGMTLSQLQTFAMKAVSRCVQDCCREGLERATACFDTEVPEAVLDQLAAPGHDRNAPLRFSESNLGLLLDDWVHLPGLIPRISLLRELFFPPAGSLRHKYGQSRKLLLPLLYARHILGSLAKRLTLK